MWTEIIAWALFALSNLFWMVAYRIRMQAVGGALGENGDPPKPTQGATDLLEVVTAGFVKALEYHDLYKRYKHAVSVVVANGQVRTLYRDELNARHEARDAALIEKFGKNAVAALAPEKRQELWNELGLGKAS